MPMIIVAIGAILMFAYSSFGAEVAARNSAFGIFGTHSAREFPQYVEQLGSEESFYRWATRHCNMLGAHYTRMNGSIVWQLIEPELGAGFRWNNRIDARGPQGDRFVALVRAESEFRHISERICRFCQLWVSMVTR